MTSSLGCSPSTGFPISAIRFASSSLDVSFLSGTSEQRRREERSEQDERTSIRSWRSASYHVLYQQWSMRGSSNASSSNNIDYFLEETPLNSFGNVYTVQLSVGGAPSHTAFETTPIIYASTSLISFVSVVIYVFVKCFFICAGTLTKACLFPQRYFMQILWSQSIKYIS